MKFKVGDKVNHITGIDSGKIYKVMMLPGSPPPGWQPTKENKYTPPMIPDQPAYLVHWIGRWKGNNIPIFEYTLKIDEKWLLSKNRRDKLNEILK